MTKFVPVKLCHKVFHPSNGANLDFSPVIFIHGLLASKEMWDNIPQIIADKTRRQTYTYDARNHGDSEHTNDFNFDLNVDDLFHFMDTMDIPKAVLVGHSMGSLTATNAALRKPERVEKIFSEDMFIKKIPKELLDPIRLVVEMGAQGVRQIPHNVSESKAQEYFLGSFLDKLPIDHPFLKERETLAKIKIPLNRKPDGSYEVKCNTVVIIQAIRNAETLMSDPKGEFNGPAFFMYGTESQFAVFKEEGHIKKHFPNAELIGFEGAAHNIHVEFPEKFVEMILERLQIWTK